MSDPFYDLGKKLGESLVKGFRDGAGPLSEMVLKPAPKKEWKPLTRPSPSIHKEKLPTQFKVASRSEAVSCPVPGCKKKVYAKGLCTRHYQKAARLGLLNNQSTVAFQTLATDHRKKCLRKVAKK